MAVSLRLLLFLCLFGLAACGGRDRQVVGGEGILLGDAASLMGEDEERARGFLLDMAFVVESNMDDPEMAVDRFQALFAVNGEAMLENARALEARFASFTGNERRLYEAQLSAYLYEANEGWRHQINTFSSRHSTEGRAILTLVETHDQ